MDLMTLSLAVGCALAAAAPGKPAELVPPLAPFDSTAFVSNVDNPYFPLDPGSILVYETLEGKAKGVDSVFVTRERRTILGVPAIVVRDRSYVAGKLTEDTADWYAQDKRGNVWYLGEDTKEYRDGKVTSTTGSWEAGRDGAHGGIVMPGVPEVGMQYRQEYRPGVAEDMASIQSLDGRALVMGDSVTACVETEEWSPLERGVRELKLYAPGLGLVLQRTKAGGSESMRLVRVVRP